MNYFLTILISTLILSFNANLRLLSAQELPPPEFEEETTEIVEEPEVVDEPQSEESSSPELSEVFTGTLAEDDEDNRNELPEEAELFADDEENEEDINEEEENFTDEEITEPTHLLIFDVISHVQFAESKIESTSLEEEISFNEPFMEVEYQTRFETPIYLGKKKQTIDVVAEHSIDNWGSLAKNEFFDCQFRIEIFDLEVAITSKLNQRAPVILIDGEAENENTEDEIPLGEAALKIDFSKDAKEIWYSFCTEFSSGASLNTGDDISEEYLLESLKLLTPSITSLVFEEYNPSETAFIELETIDGAIKDEDVKHDIFISATGRITLEPL